MRLDFWPFNRRRKAEERAKLERLRQAEQRWKPNSDPAWLRRKTELENGCDVSVGSPSPTQLRQGFLTPESQKAERIKQLVQQAENIMSELKTLRGNDAPCPTEHDDSRVQHWGKTNFIPSQKAVSYTGKSTMTVRQGGTSYVSPIVVQQNNDDSFIAGMVAAEAINSLSSTPAPVDDTPSFTGFSGGDSGGGGASDSWSSSDTSSSDSSSSCDSSSSDSGGDS